MYVERWTLNFERGVGDAEVCKVDAGLLCHDGFHPRKVNSKRLERRAPAVK